MIIVNKNRRNNKNKEAILSNHHKNNNYSLYLVLLDLLNHLNSPELIFLFHLSQKDHLKHPKDVPPNKVWRLMKLLNKKVRSRTRWFQPEEVPKIVHPAADQEIDELSMFKDLIFLNYKFYKMKSTTYYPSHFTMYSSSYSVIL